MKTSGKNMADIYFWNIFLFFRLRWKKMGLNHWLTTQRERILHSYRWLTTSAYYSQRWEKARDGQCGSENLGNKILKWLAFMCQLLLTWLLFVVVIWILHWFALLVTRHNHLQKVIFYSLHPIDFNNYMVK